LSRLEIVTSTVGFNNNSRSVGYKVGNKPTHRRLAPKGDPIDVVSL
jgi:hypothetical protein